MHITPDELQGRENKAKAGIVARLVIG